MPPLYAGIGGVVRKLTDMHTGINGVVTPLTEMWAGVGGVQRKIFGKEYLWNICQIAEGSRSGPTIMFWCYRLTAGETRTMYRAKTISDLYDEGVRQSVVISKGRYPTTNWFEGYYVISDIDLQDGRLCSFVDENSRISGYENTDGTWNFIGYAYEIDSYAAGSVVTTITSTDRNAYPDNAKVGKYWYVFQGQV